MSIEAMQAALEELRSCGKDETNSTAIPRLLEDIAKAQARKPYGWARARANVIYKNKAEVPHGFTSFPLYKE